MQWRALRPRPGIEVCRHSYTTVRSICETVV